MAEIQKNRSPVANRLTIETSWEASEHGSSEDRATAAAIGISVDDISLTDAYNSFEQKVTQTAHLSAYRLAEWLAWNWWRLRWEPLKHSTSWKLAHRISSIGGGYVWPNITIFSDGQQMQIDARATEQRSAEPLRYVKNYSKPLRAEAFETCVEIFVRGVCDRLEAEGVASSNLSDIWNDVQAERADKSLSIRRKLEAALGFDPDEADQVLINRLINDIGALGESGVSELASGASVSAPPSSIDLKSWAETFGVNRDIRNSVRLVDRSETALPNAEAWRRGKSAAKALRREQHLGDAPIQTRSLLEMIGSSASPAAFREGAPLSFELAENVVIGRIVIRSARSTSQRFDLARLLGDHIATPSGERLVPVTGSYTYRQKMQRAFAAEYLSPFNAVDQMMEGDYDDDNVIESVASHFEVSPLSIKASLANHGRIGREDVWVD